MIDVTLLPGPYSVYTRSIATCAGSPRFNSISISDQNVFRKEYKCLHLPRSAAVKCRAALFPLRPSWYSVHKVCTSRGSLDSEAADGGAVATRGVDVQSSLGCVGTRRIIPRRSTPRRIRFNSFLILAVDCWIWVAVDVCESSSRRFNERTSNCSSTMRLACSTVLC